MVIWKSISQRVRRAWAAAGLSAGLLCLPIPTQGQSGFSGGVSAPLIAALTARFGSEAATRIDTWRRALQALKQPEGRRMPEVELLDAVNRFFNRHMAFVDDLSHWGVEDYWASPAEFVASGGGDCEDYVLAKYYALKELGVPIARLRITYVRSTRSKQPHMILAYYAAPVTEPLILDNLDARILPAAQRTDLTPVYGFNDDELWLARPGSPTKAGSATQVRLWRELQEKLQREQAR